MSLLPNFDVTSANAELVLTVEQILPAGHVLQQFGTDAAASMDAVDLAEARMGVDGKLVAGVIYNPLPVTITLEAASPSFAALSLVAEAMRANKTVYACNLVITLPSISAVYTYSRGVMLNGMIMPPVQKTLQPTTWTFNFETLERASLGLIGSGGGLVNNVTGGLGL